MAESPADWLSVTLEVLSIFALPTLCVVRLRRWLLRPIKSKQELLKWLAAYVLVGVVFPIATQTIWTVTEEPTTGFNWLNVFSTLAGIVFMRTYEFSYYKILKIFIAAWRGTLDPRDYPEPPLYTNRKF